MFKRNQLKILICLIVFEGTTGSTGFALASDRIGSKSWSGVGSASCESLKACEQALKSESDRQAASAQVAKIASQYTGAHKLAPEEQSCYYYYLARLLEENAFPKEAAEVKELAVKSFMSVSSKDVPTFQVSEAELFTKLRKQNGTTQMMRYSVGKNQQLKAATEMGVPDEIGLAALRGWYSELRKKLMTAVGDNNEAIALREHAMTSSEDGILTKMGIIESDASQVVHLFEKIEEKAKVWSKGKNKTEPIDIVVYAHGGLTSELDAAITAAKQRKWWMANKVYPIYLFWESGLVDMVSDRDGWMLVRDLSSPTPVTQVAYLKSREFCNAPPAECDQILEDLTRVPVGRLWDRMKKRAETICAPCSIDFSSPLTMTNTKSGTMLIACLDRLTQRNVPYRLHLVGHSAGSILLRGVVDNLGVKKIPIESVQFLAPAITLKDFEAGYGEHLTPQSIKKLCIYDLSDAREINDKHTKALFFTYHKSLLYLVSRALEASASGSEVPLLGMAKFLNQKTYSGAPTTFIEGLKGKNVELITTPDNEGTFGKECNAMSHGGFGVEESTMSTVVRKIKGDNYPIVRFPKQPVEIEN